MILDSILATIYLFLGILFLIIGKDVTIHDRFAGVKVLSLIGSSFFFVMSFAFVIKVGLAYAKEIFGG